MPNFNINKIRSAGLRYIVADYVDPEDSNTEAQFWAFENMPVREATYWRLPYKLLCPVAYDENYKKYWARVLNWRLKGREFVMPIYDAPFGISWEDEPYDIVKHGLIAECDLKIWPEFRV